MEKTGCKIICGAPTTLAVKELMMMVVMMMLYTYSFPTSKLLLSIFAEYFLRTDMVPCEPNGLCMGSQLD